MSQNWDHIYLNPIHRPCVRSKGSAQTNWWKQLRWIINQCLLSNVETFSVDCQDFISTENVEFILPYYDQLFQTVPTQCTFNSHSLISSILLQDYLQELQADKPWFLFISMLGLIWYSCLDKQVKPVHHPRRGKIYEKEKREGLKRDGFILCEANQ